MKKLHLIIGLLIFSIAVTAQTVVTNAYGDTFKIHNRDTTKPAELVLKNASRTCNGCVLTNTGNGKTAFVAASGGDTTSLSNRINLKVNISDTASMLSKYLHKTDTASLSNRINFKVNISDTASMLSKYLRKTDTASLNNRINLKVNISDTATMLTPYLRKIDTASLSNRINVKFTLPSLTSGSVLFSNGSTIAQNNSNFFWDNTNVRLGLGTNSPQARLQLQGYGSGSTVEVARLSNEAYHTLLNMYCASSTGSYRNILAANKSNGTLASPLALVNGDQIFTFSANGWDGAAYQSRASLDFIVDGTVGSGNVPTAIHFQTGSNAARALRMTIGSSGSVNIAALGTGTVYSNSGTLTNTNPSDENLKHNIKDLEYGLEEILQLKPKQYYYNSDSTDSQLKYGFIAQEVKPIMPSVVRKLDETYLGLESDGIYVAMVKAIQQLEARVKELECKLNK